MDIKSQIAEVLKNYRSLEYDSDSNSFKGKICISVNDCYDIVIDLSTYPDSFPVVFEIGERIPPKMDRHKYSDSDACCFSTSAKAQVMLKTKITSLLIFIKEIVVPYFKSNSFYELNGRYANSTYSHGLSGIIEGYKDILCLPESTTELIICTIIHNRLKGVKLEIRDACYCGSGLTLKKCSNGHHNTAYRNFRKIDREVLMADFYSFYTKWNSRSVS
jgi:hypothetical protein